MASRKYSSIARKLSWRVVPRRTSRIDDPELVHVEIVEVEDQVTADRPVDRLERRVAVEQLDRQLEEVGGEVLVQVAEELLLARVDGAFERRRGGQDLAILIDEQRWPVSLRKVCWPMTG